MLVDNALELFDQRETLRKIESNFECIALVTHVHVLERERNLLKYILTL